MPRPLQAIPDGAAVMVDANVIVYALTPQAQLHQPCRTLLERGVRGAVRLRTTVAIVADVLHCAMVLEVISQGHTQRSADAMLLLKRQPQLVSQLTRYRIILRDLWPEQMGDGNLFQRVLLSPAIERLLQVHPDHHILEVACGNGALTSRLASLGARVVALDFSAGFLNLAWSRSTEYAERIEYVLVDATDEEVLLALG